MSSIRELTYQQLKEQRRIFDNAMGFALDDITRKTFGLAIEGINAEMDRRHRKTIMSMVVTVNVLVIVTILGGCNTAREGLHLGGAICQDVGCLLNQGAKNIQTQEK